MHHRLRPCIFVLLHRAHLWSKLRNRAHWTWPTSAAIGCALRENAWFTCKSKSRLYCSDDAFYCSTQHSTPTKSVWLWCVLTGRNGTITSLTWLSGCRPSIVCCQDASTSRRSTCTLSSQTKVLKNCNANYFPPHHKHLAPVAQRTPLTVRAISWRSLFCSIDRHCRRNQVPARVLKNDALCCGLACDRRETLSTDQSPANNST